MKTTHCTSIVIALLALMGTAVQLPAAVKVDTTEPIETLVAFRVAADKYISTSTSNSLVLAISKIGSKEKFTIIDLTGGNLQDGDEVRVRYMPHAKAGEVPKPSYWLENNAGVRRGHDGDVFKLKRVDTKFVLMTPTGKFVAPPTNEHALGVSAKQDGALLVEIIDVNSGASVIQPAPVSTAPAASPPTPSSIPEKTETPPPAPTSPPAADKPATQ
jgi:hypothetical protein